jgi:diaminopimelate decarboxylase
MFDLRVEVKKATNIVLNYLDLGGGLPVSTVREFGLRDTVLHRRLRLRAVPPDLRRPGWPQFAAAIAKAIDGGVARTGMPRPQIFFEPGRALTSQAQLLLLRVGIVKKRTDGNLIAISDGGRSTNAMPLSTEYHEVFLANRMSAVDECPHTIVGGLCTPGDWTFMRKDLPLLESGDLLAVMDSGAYFTSFANNFSFPRPAIVMVRDGQARVIRRRESFESMVAMDEGMVVRPMPRPSVFP